MSFTCITMACLLLSPGVLRGPSWPVNVDELRLLLQTKRFADLEKVIVEAQDDFDASRTTEDDPWAKMGAFLNDEGITEKALSLWVAQAPGSYAALAARGLYYESTGWTIRGPEWVQHTASGRLKTMHDMHALAEADCEKALAIKPTLVACHVALINIARGAGDEERASRRYDVARRAVPGSILVAMARLQSLTPRWGGSYGEMRALLQELTKDSLWQKSGGRALLGHIAADQASLAALENDYGKAVELYTEAIAQGGGLAAYYAGRGINAHRLGRKADALKDYDRAVEMAPRGWPYGETRLSAVLASRASIEHSSGQQAEAERDIRDSLLIDPRNDYALQWARVIMPPRPSPKPEVPVRP